jgi:ketopantoate reductase
MRIAVIGAGGVGGYFGARLSRGGHDVVFIARGAHLAAIRTDGLRVQSPLGDMHLRDLVITNDPAELEPAELVILGVKYGTPNLLPSGSNRCCGRTQPWSRSRTASSRTASCGPCSGPPT